MRVGEKDRLGKREGEDTGCAARVFYYCASRIIIGGHRYGHCVTTVALSLGNLWAGSSVRQNKLVKEASVCCPFGILLIPGNPSYVHRDHLVILMTDNTSSM